MLLFLGQILKKTFAKHFLFLHFLAKHFLFLHSSHLIIFPTVFNNGCICLFNTRFVVGEAALPIGTPSSLKKIMSPNIVN